MQTAASFIAPTAEVAAQGTPKNLHQKMRSSKWAWPVAWDRVSLPADEEAAGLLIEECVRRLPLMVECLRRLVAAGRYKRARKLQRKMLHSHTALIAAFAKGIKKKLWKMPAKILVAVAVQTSMWKFAGEAPEVKFLPKDTGGERVTLSYGPIEYGRQYLAKVAAEPLASLSDRQFLLRGGVPALFSWLGDYLPKAKVVLITDVPNCFLSLSRKRVENDGLLPRPVLRSILFEPQNGAKMPYKNIKKDGHVSVSGVLPQTYEESAVYDLISGCGEYEGRGIPPGSALSSLVAEVRLRLLLDTAEAAAEGVLAASFADNIIILAPSNATAEACKSALHDFALGELGADAACALRTRTEKVLKSKGFRFLKRDIRVRNGKLIVRLPEDRREMYLIKLALTKLHGNLSDEQVTRRLKAWVAAHKGDTKVRSAAKRFAKEYSLKLT